MEVVFMLENVGNVGNDSKLRVDNTMNNPPKMGGGSPIDTVGNVGMDDKGFSPNTMNHNPTKPVPKGNPIVSPGNVQNG